MTIKKLCIFFSICYFCTNIYAQTVNTLGVNYTVHSKSLNEDRQIQVFVPESYKTSNKKYPVLYMLDGQRLFPYGVSLLKSYTQFRQTPEFIIVGITNKYPDRFGHFIDIEKRFLKFIEEDVISFIDNSFRTTDKRILFGWEYGGSFVIQTMMDKPHLFDAFLAASPFPLNNKIEELDNFLSNNPRINNMLFFSVSPNEDQVNIGTKKLDSLLKLKAPKTLNWNYKELENEEHRSTPYSTIYFGIKKFYHYYPELQFDNLDEFKNSGGLGYVYDYYQKRALKFGFSKELSDWTMFSLTRNTIRADDYKQFEILVNEFSKTGFISRLRVRRACSIAEFYLKNKQYDKAIDLFKLLVKKHPNSERPLNGLGDIYKELKKEKKASVYYKKAKKVSETN